MKAHWLANVREMCVFNVQHVIVATSDSITSDSYLINLITKLYKPTFDCILMNISYLSFVHIFH